LSDIESDLRSLARELAFPATPELAPSVAARLAIRRPGKRRRVGRQVALAASALILAAGGAFAAEPGIRHAVLRWLGVRTVRIERVPSLPQLTAGPAGRGLGLGRRRELAGRFPGADSAASAVRGLPRGLAPRRPGVVRLPPGPGLRRAPGTGTGLLITEFRGLQPCEYIGKSLGPGTSAELVTVGGDPGVWISGKPHELAFVDSRGEVRAQTLRLAGNTLVWRHGTVLIRLEAMISRPALTADRTALGAPPRGNLVPSDPRNLVSGGSNPPITPFRLILAVPFAQELGVEM